MITIHEENHLDIECKKVSKSYLEMGEFVTIETFIEQIQDGYFHHSDCDGQWACLDSNGVAYAGNSIDFIIDWEDTVQFIDKPEWATHAIWSSK